MKGVFVAVVFLLVFAVVAPKEAEASLLRVDGEGKIIWSVLASEDELSLGVPSHSSIEVKSAAKTAGDNFSKIMLSQRDNKVTMVVSSDSETRNLELSNWNEDIVQLEERPEIASMSVGLSGDKFEIKQKNIAAVTSFPLTIDAADARLLLKTSTGEKYLSVLPFQAVETLMKSKLISRVENNKIEIIEDNGKLQYKISGEKIFKIMDFFDYPVFVTSNVSASTGEVLSVDGPSWFKVLNFLMT